MRRLIDRLREVIEGSLVDVDDSIDVVSEVIKSVLRDNEWLVCQELIYKPDSLEEVPHDQVAEQIVQELEGDDILDPQYRGAVKEDVEHILHDYYVLG